jgi:glutamyl-tRNA synthetase
LVQKFDVRDVNRAPARFDMDKLTWLNQHYLKTDAPEKVALHLIPHLEDLHYAMSHGPNPAEIVVALRDRVKTLKEMAQASRYFFTDTLEFDAKAVAKHLTADARGMLVTLRERLAALPVWEAPAIHAAIETLAAERGVGLGKIAQPVRVAVSGGTVSPPIDQTLALLGRERALARLAVTGPSC